MPDRSGGSGRRQMVQLARAGTAAPIARPWKLWMLAGTIIRGPKPAARSKPLASLVPAVAITLSCRCFPLVAGACRRLTKSRQLPLLTAATADMCGRLLAGLVLCNRLLCNQLLPRAKQKQIARELSRMERPMQSWKARRQTPFCRDLARPRGNDTCEGGHTSTIEVLVRRRSLITTELSLAHSLVPLAGSSRLEGGVGGQRLLISARNVQFS